MNAEQRTKIEPLLKPDELALDTRSIEDGTDENGFPIFKTIIENLPNHFQVIRYLEPYNGAIVRDLDYKEVLQDEAEKQA